ncbi:MAG: YqgE/AlgH family protein [Mariprofundaceae bacterium]
MSVPTLAGKALLAMPTLDDPNFRDAVVLVCHHDDEGCMGLIVNRPMALTLEQVLDDLGLYPDEAEAAGLPELALDRAVHRNTPVFEGGPVDPHRGFILHDGWHGYESTMQVTSELHLSASRDALEAIARNAGPEHFLFLLGYAGWGAGQLAREIAENAWLIAPVSQRLLFQEPPEARWDFAARCMGVDRAQLSSQIGHA